MIIPLLRRYKLPILLLVAGLVFQLVVLPSAFPSSHYDVLGIPRGAGVAEVEDAYAKLESKWNAGVEVPRTEDFVKIRYAFELLRNPLWKRDYDQFGIDEHLHVLEKVREKYKGERFSVIELPILNALDSGFADHLYNQLTYADYTSRLGKNKAWLIQVYSSGSSRSAEFSGSWSRIVDLLDGVAETGVVELGDHKLASYLAERRYGGRPFFKNGMPAFVAFSPNCRSLSCLKRYYGDLSVDAVVDWMATEVLGSPRVFYYTKESLDQQFIAKSGRHKVKAIFFSKTGQRAPPFLREAAKVYHAHVSTALVLWQDEDASTWFNRFELETAPAIVFLKDPGVKPIIYYGNWNASSVVHLIDQNKYHDLPQLRRITSMELGCDARGKSRVEDDRAWYCVILAGRPSLQLNIMRETMRRIQKKLADYESLIDENKESSLEQPAADALRQKRLTLAWLDGETQSSYCSFYLHSETSYETCGSRKFGDISDVPRLFLVRYRRNSSEVVQKIEKKIKSVWDMSEDVDVNLASQLVARYNGSEDISEIIQWISQTIKDGDTRELPYFRAKTPDLVPEDADQVLSKSIQGIISKRGGMMKRLQSISISICDRLKDPRLGPILLLAACISFSTIFLQKNQTTSSVPMEVDGKSRKERPRASSSKKGAPPYSITDAVPEDAKQISLSDSDSDN